MPNRATSVEVRRHGAVLVVKLVGYYNRAMAMQVRDQVNTEIERAPTRKVVLDMRSCVCLLTCDEWGALSKELSESPIQAPLGVLVPEGQLSGAWKLCISLARGGHIRLPFETVEQVAMWAEVASTALRPARRFAPVS